MAQSRVTPSRVYRQVTLIYPGSESMYQRAVAIEARIDQMVLTNFPDRIHCLLQRCDRCSTIHCPGLTIASIALPVFSGTSGFPLSYMHGDTMPHPSKFSMPYVIFCRA